MFGTDWPYFARTAEDYRRLWAVFEEARLGLAADEREMVLSGNALRFLGLG